MSTKTDSLRAFKGKQTTPKRSVAEKTGAPVEKKRLGRPASGNISLSPKAVRFSETVLQKLAALSSQEYTNRNFTNLVETMVLQGIPKLEADLGIVWNDETSSYEPA